MKLQPLKQPPAFIAAVVILLVSIAAISRLDFFERLERMTYDWRVREATNSPYACAPNLGFVFINDETIQRVRYRPLTGGSGR